MRRGTQRRQSSSRYWEKLASHTVAGSQQVASNPDAGHGPAGADPYRKYAEARLYRSKVTKMSLLPRCEQSSQPSFFCPPNDFASPASPPHLEISNHSPPMVVSLSRAI